jgi:PPK2 family polyphosphate:nucleotide phosphotransferase
MENYRIKLGSDFKLKDIDPQSIGNWEGGKEKAREKLLELRQELDALQTVLYAEGKHKVLMVIQAMDSGGKDGTIRSVFEGVNPQGVKVANFKVPTPIELAHDYLWRVHPQVPGKGELVIFNRSHYEDVLVVRVHDWIDEKTCNRRYKQIRDFEKMLVEEGTTILKFFLHISKEEQRVRLLERIDTPEKQWKFNPGDLQERDLWPKYMEAFEDAIRETSTEEAPWYVIPANRNWHRDLLVADILVETLKKLKMRYPVPLEDLLKYRSVLEKS